MKMYKGTCTKLRYIFTSILLLSVCIICTGCSVADRLFQYGKSIATGTPYVSEEERVYNEAVDNFFDALESGDKKAMQDMFSTSVQREDKDLSEQLDLLMEVFPEKLDFSGRDGSSVHGSYSNDHGKHSSSVDSRFALVSNGDYFFCRFYLTYENDFDKEKIGITKIVFFTADYYCAAKYEQRDVDYRFEEASGHGLFVYADYTMDEEVRVIGGDPYKYTTRNAPLNKEEVKKFFETSNSYSEFVEKFGEPNAINLYSDYIYEIPNENGQLRYLRLFVDDRINSISVISVCDDFDWLYNIWTLKDGFDTTKK